MVLLSARIGVFGTARCDQVSAWLDCRLHRRRHVFVVNLASSVTRNDHQIELHWHAMLAHQFMDCCSDKRDLLQIFVNAVFDQETRSKIQWWQQSIVICMQCLMNWQLIELTPCFTAIAYDTRTADERHTVTHVETRRQSQRLTTQRFGEGRHNIGVHHRMHRIKLFIVAVIIIIVIVIVVVVHLLLILAIIVAIIIRLTRFCHIKKSGIAQILFEEHTHVNIAQYMQQTRSIMFHACSDHTNERQVFSVFAVGSHTV
mmetsp:Transcript_33051/g.53661  ORF Transcript_33051/g.53661 Transcript_33051/m.53661 type:complete len:258 (+) Transcript_33051:1075-1848(+)